MISANRIKYAGYSSEDFDVFCQFAFDSDNGESDSFLNREAISSDSYHGKFKRVHGYKYSDSFSPTFTFIKKDFGDFTFEEQRRVLSWLTSKSTPSFLTVYNDESDTIAFECLGAFVEPKPYKLGNNRTVGVIVRFESTTPWALSPLCILTKEPQDPTLDIDISTDDWEAPIYPRITIKPNNETDITITNTHTDENGIIKIFSTTIKNNIKGETIILDGANRTVSSSRATGRVFGDDFDWKWIPLLNGNNSLAVDGNCIIIAEYRTPIKCGEY
jgi:hypothetical protein